MYSLTATLHHHLGALRLHWRRHRAFPPMEELAVVLGVKSKGGVHKTLGRLVDEGLLERVGSRYAPTEAFFALPLVGPARAGLPDPADAGQAPEAMCVESFLIDHPDQTVYCRVKGDSMRDAGLLDGDIAVVDRSTPAKAGDIVVAVVDGEITVKHLRANGSPETWILEPANPAYAVIHPQGSLEMLGVVVGSFRRFRR